MAQREGLSNAGKPKHSFVIAVRRAKSIDKTAAPQQTSSPENSRQRNQTRVGSPNRENWALTALFTRINCSASGR